MTEFQVSPTSNALVYHRQLPSSPVQHEIREDVSRYYMVYRAENRTILYYLVARTLTQCKHHCFYTFKYTLPFFLPESCSLTALPYDNEGSKEVMVGKYLNV